jgi:alpha-tubulin suppressor-like RCC1 family protein
MLRSLLRPGKEVTFPTKVVFPESAGPIASVSVGGRHTLATDAASRTFAFGDDRRIQLGLGDTRTSGNDERHSYGVIHEDALGGKKNFKNEIRRNAHYRYYDPHMQCSPVEVVPPTAYNRPAYPPASVVVCGEDFTVALHRDSPDWYTEDQMTNVIQCCGENGEGQCGRNLQQQQQPWSVVRMPKRSKTVVVACGQAHSLALLDSGELFAWGSNQQGQVGNGKRATVSRPLKVAFSQGAQRIKATPTEAPSNPPPPSPEPAPTAGGLASLFSRRERGPLPEPQRAPAHPAVELPGKVVAVICGFRNSAVIVEVAEANPGQL